MTNDILNRVIEVVASELSIDPAEVVPGASFQDDLGADSLDLVELIMTIQEEFDVNINDDTTKQIKTVQDVVDFITKYRQQ
ncbi:MAG: acyl carrier protein [Deltaproteobacteria bacterium]|nr:acyl carrier protein [Deltaproteobacteria bacterium]